MDFAIIKLIWKDEKGMFESVDNISIDLNIYIFDKLIHNDSYIYLLFRTYPVNKKGNK